MRALLLGLTLALAAFGQAGTPDCQFSFSFSASGTGTVFANKSTPCIEWRVTYYTASGTVVSLKLEGAADLANAPTGSYTALIATQGTSNPSTTAAEGTIALCCDYYPWVRMNLTSFTGTTLTGRVYGWKAPDTGPFSNSGSSGGGGTPEYCTLKVAFSNPGTGSTQLVAVNGTTTIRVCSFFFSGDTITTMQLVTGTGSTCTSPTAETGVISGAGGGLFGVAFDLGQSPLVTTAAKTLCLSLSTASTGGGYIIYSQR